MEIGRYVVATGEVPSLGFGRIPGMFVGTILASLLVYLAFLTDGWAAGAGVRSSRSSPATSQVNFLVSKISPGSDLSFW